jgi:hypothetical protein
MMTPRSWDDIENKYLNSVQYGRHHYKMVELIRHIKSAGYSNRIYGTTSLDTLLLSIYSPMDRFKETLHISFNRANNKWCFTYHEQPFRQPEFVREYDEDKIIEKLDYFVKMVRW